MCKPIIVRRGPYPNIIIDQQHADPDFARALAEAMKQVRFQNMGEMSSIFKRLKQKGIRNAFQHYMLNVLERPVPKDDRNIIHGCCSLEMRIQKLVGEAALSTFSEADAARFFPYNSFWVGIGDSEPFFRVSCHSFKEAVLGRTEVRYSPLRPRIGHGRGQILAFTEHTGDRIFQREGMPQIDPFALFSFHNLLNGKAFEVPPIFWTVG